jgi:hypothetical protein
MHVHGRLRVSACVRAPRLLRVCAYVRVRIGVRDSVRVSSCKGRV